MAEIKARRRRGLTVAAGVVTALVLADTAVWAWASRRLADDVDAQLAAAGWSLHSTRAHTTGTHWAGWPVAAEVVVDDAVLRTGPDAVPPLAWTVPNLRLRIRAWSPTRLDVLAGGAQTVTIGDTDPVPFQARSLVAAVDLTGRQPARITTTMLRIGAPGGPVELDSGTLDLLADAWSATLAGLVVPGPSGAPIAPGIESVRLHGRVEPAVPAGATARASAEAWRARSGRAAIALDEFRWGAVSATGGADLTLDSALQPALMGQITAAGLTAGVSQLATAGALAPSAATAVQAMVAILAAPSGGGPVTLPVAVRDGVLTVARIPLLRVVNLDWGPP